MYSTNENHKQLQGAFLQKWKIKQKIDSEKYKINILKIYFKYKIKDDFLKFLQSVFNTRATVNLSQV